MSEGLHTIGEFARLTGLTERALRLYDDRGLLPPADTDPQTGYRRYSSDQVDTGRLVAMLRAIQMPLAEIDQILAIQPAERSAAVGRYWYRIERELDERRQAVSEVRAEVEREESGMSNAEDAVRRGRAEGAFAAIAVLAEIDDAVEAAEAYREAMRAAYWEDKDLALTVAMAYAGTSRLLAMADRLDGDEADAAKSAAKGLMYDLASFTWPGWDEPGVDVSATDAAAGLAAARSNLWWAAELGKPDLAVSRAHWMLGAHLLTAGEHAAAVEQFTAAGDAADRAGAEAEFCLARAFGALASLASGEVTEEQLTRELEALGALEHGPDFVSQVTTARRVIGV